MDALAPLATGYAPWNAYAMRPAGLTAVLNDVVANTRRHVVECGGGVSTLFIARLLAQRGGRLMTIEDDAHWAQVLTSQLTAEGLDEHATVVHAPLTPTHLGWPGEDARWYSTAVLDGAVTGPIDVLVVDGPSAWAQATRHVRYPALPYFQSRLAKEFTIILDDVARRGERDLLGR